MHSTQSHKQQIRGSLLPVCALLLCAISPAKADGTLTTTAAPQDKALKFLRTSLTQRTYKSPLELKAESLTAEEVAGRVQKILLTRKPTVTTRIEVRDLLPTKHSFDVKNSTVGRVLNSTAVLAGGKLWFFTDYVLLAPESALSDEERVVIKDGFGGEWSELDSIARSAARSRKQLALSAFVNEEIKAKFAKGGADAKGEGPNITFAQLSPDSKAMVQELVADTNEAIRNRPSGEPRHRDPLSVSSNTVLRFEANHKGALAIDFPKPEFGWIVDKEGIMLVNWSIGGGGVIFRSGEGEQNPASPSRPSLPLDLSGGKS